MLGDSRAQGDGDVCKIEELELRGGAQAHEEPAAGGKYRVRGDEERDAGQSDARMLSRTRNHGSTVRHTRFGEAHSV
jgi:hypothetical protein